MENPTKDHETGEYHALGEKGRSSLNGTIDALERVGEAIGGWAAKFDVRQTGISYHAKFAQKAAVNVGLDFANQLGAAPAMLADACRRLLAADEEIVRLRARLDEAQLRSIEARNPGIDMEEVRRARSTQ